MFYHILQATTWRLVYHVTESVEIVEGTRYGW